MSPRETAGQRLRDRLAEERSEDGTNFALLRVLETAEQHRDFADNYGLDLPWVPALRGMEIAIPGSFARLAELADRPLSEQRALFHRLVAAFWRDPALGLQRHVVDADARTQCETAIALHERAAGGEAVERAAWRPARSALGRLALPTLQGKAAATIAAACWDVDAVPTLLVDVMAEWRTLIQLELDTREGWDGDAMREQDMAMITAAMDRAAGRPPEGAGADWAKSEEGQEYNRRVQDAIVAFNADPPAGYGRRTMAVSAALEAGFGTLVDTAVDLVAGARRPA